MWPQAEDHRDRKNDHPEQLEQVDAAIRKAEQATAQVVECENRRWFDIPEVDVELQSFVEATRVGKKQRLIPIQGHLHPDQACGDNDEKRCSVPAELKSAKPSTVRGPGARWLRVR